MDVDRSEVWISTIEPYIEDLLVLYHPEWDLAEIESKAPLFTSSLESLFHEIFALPEDPALREIGYRQAIARFKSVDQQSV